jgi:orotate phosphoribosyltransferase
MNRLTTLLAQSLVVTALLATPAFADDDEELKKDLTAGIALHGLPCGQVVAVKVQGENDYAAACKDGNNYRVYLNAAGRVVVEAQK